MMLVNSPVWHASYIAKGQVSWRTSLQDPLLPKWETERRHIMGILSPIFATH